MTELDERTTVEDIEFKLLIDGIQMKFGYDFREYAESSLRRRLQVVLTRFGFKNPMTLLERILRDSDFFRQILPHLTVGTTEMFRDPEFYLSLRETIIPTLKTFPNLNIWIAGCSSGEEIYSLAILLKESGLGDKSVIFATDINPSALKTASDGIYSLDSAETYARNYAAAGGTRKFSDYYTSAYGYMKMDVDLATNFVLSEHNLVVDHIFAECHLILCRNVLIYFNKTLQNRALGLFTDSLRYGGFLALGSKENLRFTNVADAYEVVDPKWRLYRKRRAELTTAGGKEWL